MGQFLVTLYNSKTGTSPTYYSEAPSLEACRKYEEGVMQRLQNVRPQISLVSVSEVSDNEPARTR